MRSTNVWLPDAGDRSGREAAPGTD